MSVRQSIAFPTIGKIRKGLPKQKVEKNYGGQTKTIDVMGRDLKTKFRIELLPGLKPEMKEKFHETFKKFYVKYPDNFLTPEGYEMEYIRAVIPTKQALAGFRWSNEAYNGTNVLIARAEGDRYTFRRNPVTMEVEVENGEPYEKFDFNNPLMYEKGNNEYKLQLKSSSTLNLFLPEFGEFVSFEMKSTSYIDSLNIRKNLMAVQEIADMVNGGNAGWIPLDIYRSEQETPYVSNGSGHKSKQYFIQIKANSEWSKKAIAEMNTFPVSFGGMKAEDFAPPIEIITRELIEDGGDEEEGVPAEQVIEEVKASVTEENIQEEVSEEKKPAEDASVFKEKHEKIRVLYAEIKLMTPDTKKMALDLLKKYEPEKGDYRKVSNFDTLKEIYNGLKQIKKENK